MKRVLLTGGAGFMGSTVARHLVAAGHEVVVYDALTYAGDSANLEGVEVSLQHADVCDGARLWPAVARADVVVHMAAESHVDRSFVDPDRFVRTNVDGTRNVLEACVAAGNLPLVHVSTDEVFGSAPAGTAFGEDAPLRPGNPYAATKAAAECLLLAWRNTYGLRARVVRCTNNYGLRQHPEKAVAGWVRRAACGEPLPLHGRGDAVRDWLHVDDFARGLLAVVAYEGPREVFHLAGRQPRTNREIASLIASCAGGAPLVEVPDRPGQDARYALEDGPTRADLGWAPRIPLEEGIRALVRALR
jgi:dTDP-glucose 4,6-dehydratase